MLQNFDFSVIFLYLGRVQKEEALKFRVTKASEASEIEKVFCFWTKFKSVGFFSTARSQKRYFLVIFFFVNRFTDTRLLLGRIGFHLFMFLFFYIFVSCINTSFSDQLLYCRVWYFIIRLLFLAQGSFPSSSCSFSSLLSDLYRQLVVISSSTTVLFSLCFFVWSYFLRWGSVFCYAWLIYFICYLCSRLCTPLMFCCFLICIFASFKKDFLLGWLLSNKFILYQILKSFLLSITCRTMHYYIHLFLDKVLPVSKFNKI